MHSNKKADVKQQCNWCIAFTLKIASKLEIGIYPGFELVTEKSFTIICE